MRMIDIIAKKRDKEILTAEEISFWIDGVVNNTIPEYQTSALLMAIVLNGMNDDETANLTNTMVHSGDIFDLSGINGIKVDKHSTGGVGDKTTLTLGPLVASCGAKVAKMSGRGLGHTGGTLDKLESISGFNIVLEEEQFIKQVNDISIALIGQSKSTVPADKTLYGLRDVTGTVSSIPLIASSIMSKKLASGSDAILLDVKYGEGAFMKTKEDALELAEKMIAIGNKLNKNIKAMITNMNQHLGYAIGNALEVKEAIETLLGHGPEDFTELCYQSASIMLQQANIVSSDEEAIKLIKEKIESKEAFNKLVELVNAQGGDVNQVLNTDLLPKAKYITEIKSTKTGYITDIDSHILGNCGMEIGAGRSKATDVINHAVGLIADKKVGTSVTEGDRICTVYHDSILSDEWISKLISAYTIETELGQIDDLIYKVI